jgi:hypothetical protein
VSFTGFVGDHPSFARTATGWYFMRVSFMLTAYDSGSQKAVGEVVGVVVHEEVVHEEVVEPEAVTVDPELVDVVDPEEVVFEELVDPEEEDVVLLVIVPEEVVPEFVVFEVVPEFVVFEEVVEIVVTGIPTKNVVVTGSDTCHAGVMTLY